MVLSVAIDGTVYIDRAGCALSPRHTASDIPNANKMLLNIPSHPDLNKSLSHFSSENP